MAAHKKTFEVEEKTVESTLVAGIHARGPAGETGELFDTISRIEGRNVSGKPLSLYYDTGYDPDSTDIEACYPIRKAVHHEGVAVHDVPGARCVTLVHEGPYEEIGRAYEKVYAYLDQKHLEAQLPTREVYVKGPGPFFKGNPRKYRTEIQIPVRHKA